MRFLVMIFLFLLLNGTLAAAAPDRSKLLTGTNGSDSQSFVEEVVVESVLQVRSPSGNRQARVNTQNSLRDGVRVAETKTLKN